MKTFVRALSLSILLMVSSIAAHAQSMIAKPTHYLSATGTNSTLVWSGPAIVQWVVPINTTATQYFLKLYNKGTAPVCGTDPVVLSFPIPANSNGGGALPLGLEGAQFPNGVGFCLTGAIADNDTTPGAAGVAINFGVVPQ